jgi:superfamily II DNA or RNA helicase
MLRQHQQEFLEICRLIKTRKELRKVVASIVPGGGKSALPVIAAKELIPYVGDAIAWIAPRTNLRNQAESAFTDGWLRGIIGHNHEIRAMVNEVDLLRDKVGYATTYQALSVASTYRINPHVELFKRRRMILFLDEVQHAYQDGEFDLALRPLVQSAAVVAVMSGSLSRHDNKRIAFLNYLDRDTSGHCLVDLNPSSTVATIKYGLADATREHAIIKINFELRDCAAAWDEVDDNDDFFGNGKIESFDGASVKDTHKGLYTALNTEFAESLLIEATEFWRNRRKHNPRSTFLIVARSIKKAQWALGILKKMGVNAGIATSDDGDEAQTSIERFRRKERPYLDALVTVAMAYEGMDAPQADVLVALTHIRSRGWIEQMIHRVTRYDSKSSLSWDNQFATIFAPKDKFFCDIMAEIKAEQAPFVTDDLNIGPPGPGGGGGGPTRVRPRESSLTESTAATFNDPPITGGTHEQLTTALKLADIHGAISTTAAQRFFEAMTGQQSPEIAPEQLAVVEDIEPPSKREDKLRKQISKLHRSGYNPHDPETSKRIELRGKAMWKIFNKRLEELTEPQLQTVFEMRHIWMKQ